VTGTGPVHWVPVFPVFPVFPISGIPGTPQRYRFLSELAVTGRYLPDSGS